jgi:hypothetical protein
MLPAIVRRMREGARLRPDNRLFVEPPSGSEDTSESLRQRSWTTRATPPRAERGGRIARTGSDIEIPNRRVATESPLGLSRSGTPPNGPEVV